MSYTNRRKGEGVLKSGGRELDGVGRTSAYDIFHSYLQRVWPGVKAKFFDRINKNSAFLIT